VEYVTGKKYFHFVPVDKSLHRRYDFYIWVRSGRVDSDFAKYLTPEKHSLLVGCVEPTITSVYDTMPTLVTNAKKYEVIEVIKGPTSNVFTITNPNPNLAYCRIVSHSITIISSWQWKLDS
jgi:hypothetical protein